MSTLSVNTPTDPLSEFEPDELSGAVEEALLQAYARDEAKRKLRARSSRWELPQARNGKELDRSPIPWRIQDVMPAGGNVILSGAAKAGKTTLGFELVRSLVCSTRGNGRLFLGKYMADQPDGQIAYFNFEMTDDQIYQYIPDDEIRNCPQVDWYMMRGSAHNFDVLDDEHFTAMAVMLRARDTEMLVLDPLQPLFSVLGIDSQNNDQVGNLLARLDELKKLSGVKEIYLNHHTGHTDTTRGRGASVLEGWPDALWNLEKSSKDQNADRYFTCKGRGPAVRDRLVFEPSTHTLSAAEDFSVGRMDLAAAKPQAWRMSTIKAVLEPAEGDTAVWMTREEILDLVNAREPSMHRSSETTIRNDVNMLAERGEIAAGPKRGKALTWGHLSTCTFAG